ncbi:MAG TPA: hypothetical protein DF712_00105 [Balneola sp.]|jgi:hypothetical protein|nr:hypothetical protein [Balneola sp.]
MANKYKYTTKFLQPIIASADIDQENIKISKASLEDLKSLIPSSVELDKNIDLVGVAFNAAVVNKFNRNHDGISTDTALAVKDYFVHKPTNIEHKKQRIVGHIVSAGFSGYGNNELLSPEELTGTSDPFNISLGAVVYRMVDRRFAELLNKSVDPDSPMHNQVSASWEIGFNDYQIAVGSENLSEAEIVTDEKQIEELSQYLKASDGRGEMDDGTIVRRLVVGNVYPLGIGFTANPAADVEGVVVSEQNNQLNMSDRRDLSATLSDEAQEILKNILNFKNNISQTEKNTVKSERESNSSIMNTNQLVQEIKSVLDEKLSSEKMSKDTFAEESVASISSIINEAIREKNEEYKQQLVSEKEEKAKIEAQHQELTASVEEMKQKLEAAEEKIRQFEDEKQHEESLARFNARMEAVEQDYELSEADLKIVASEVKELTEADEAFASYQEKLAVVFAHKGKEHLQAEKDKFDSAVAEAVEKRVSELKEVKASDDTVVEATKENLEEALEDTEQVTPEISNTNEASSGETETLRTKFQSAFSKENIKVTY